MKVFGTVLKVVAALAAIAGAVYVAVTYGDKIVAWFKKQFSSLCCCDCAEADFQEAVPAEDVPAEEGAVQAEDVDFEG